MYESDDIITYLFNEYGDGQVPLMLRLGPATTLTCGLALAPRWVGGWVSGSETWVVDWWACFIMNRVLCCADVDLAMDSAMVVGAAMPLAPIFPDHNGKQAMCTSPFSHIPYLLLSSSPRGGKGSSYRPSKQPAQSLVLWGYELSPFVKLVKEVLSELELPYTQVRGCVSLAG